MPSCLTLSIIRYGSRVKWSNPRKGVVPFPTPWCSKLLKRESLGHPWLWSPTFYYMLYMKIKNKQFSNDWTTISIKLMILHEDKNCQKSSMKIWKKLLIQPGSLKYCNFFYLLKYFSLLKKRKKKPIQILTKLGLVKHPVKMTFKTGIINWIIFFLNPASFFALSK